MYQQDQVKNLGKDRKKGDAVSLKIKVGNDGEVPETLEDLTDDEVFKELINIVVDVFSHKSEKCMLTVEVPSDGLTTVSSNSLCTSDSVSWNRLGQKRPITDVLSHLKYFETIPPRKSGKHNRNLKLPINKKPSKHNHKKELNKKLNPIVQTVLHPKQGFTDLEALFKLRQKYENSRKVHSPVNVKRNAADKQLTNDGSAANEWGQVDLFDHTTNNINDFGESNSKLNLGSQFLEVIDDIKELMVMYNGYTHTDGHRIEYHVGEIKTHAMAIRSYLANGSSVQSSSAEANDVVYFPKTRKVKSFISRTKTRKKDVTLFQIAAKQSSTRRSRKQHISRKKKSIHSKLPEEDTSMSMEEILKCYQQMKKEEMELVKVMLNRLGLSCVETEKSQTGKNSKDADCQIEITMVGQGCQTRAGLTVDESTQVSQILESKKCEPPELDIQPQIDADSLDLCTKGNDATERTKPTKMSVRAKRRLLAKSLGLERGMQTNFVNCGTRRTKRVFPEFAEEKQDAPNVTNDVETKEEPHCCFISEDVINQYDVVEQVQSKDDKILIKEEKVMSRIQNAAERLEYMQDLVEKKLGYLCKQKEFFEDMKSKNSNGVEQEESNTEYDLVREESSKSQITEIQKREEQNRGNGHASTMKIFPSYVQYPNVNLEESKDFRELLRGFEEATNKDSKSKSRSRKLKSSNMENNLHEDQIPGGKTYICNYVMEVRGCELNIGDSDSQPQLALENGNDAKVEEEKKVSITMTSTSEHNVMEGEITNESPFIDPNVSSLQVGTDKTELRIKKKTSGIKNCPRRSFCALS